MSLTIRNAEPQRKISPHFKEYELACKCCGKILYYPELILKLEHLRHIIGNLPIIVHSGYRCPSHNARVGGAKESLHMLGMAADISVKGVSIDALATAANAAGFNGIGIYRKDNFVHVDIRAWKWREVKN